MLYIFIHVNKLCFLYSVHVFGERGRGLAPESCGDPVAAEKFAFSFMNFIRNKVSRPKAPQI